MPVFRGNHNGGVVRIGPDGKIYLQVGDTGRRGQTQNLFDGPFGEGIPDDQFGGPDITNDHLTGVILRLNTDGTAPRDNPFWKVGAERGGQVGANLKKIFAYGLRNGFGMAFDPFSGDLWEQENGDDSFSEINRAQPGFNSGWMQVMGPLERVAQFKAIETTRARPARPAARRRLLRPPAGPLGPRTSPTPRVRPTTACSSSRAREFSDPEMTWKYEVAPGGIDFVSTRSSARTTRATCSSARPAAPFAAATSSACRSRTTARRSIPTTSACSDRVADNLAKYEITESESLLFGENFGVTPGHQGEPGRHALRRVLHAGHGLRDPPQVGQRPIARLADGHGPADRADATSLDRDRCAHEDAMSDLLLERAAELAAIDRAIRLARAGCCAGC